MIGAPPKTVAKKAKGKAAQPSPPTTKTKKENPKKRAAAKAPKGKVGRPKDKKDDLNIRERKFIKGLMDGLTPTEAMRQAGYAENTALVKAGEKLEKVKPTIKDLMDKRGLTDDKLLETLEEGLSATKVISAIVIKGKEEDPADERDGMKDAHSLTRDFVDVEDYPTRHRYMETGLKLKGYLMKQDLTLGNPDGSPLNINVVFVTAGRPDALG